MPSYSRAVTIAPQDIAELHTGLRGKPLLLSLFSGCGGLDIGFAEAGFRCVGAFDTDPAAVATFNLNFGDLCQKVDLSGWHPSLNAFIGKVDVVIAGPPCQGFSVAGKRKLNDPRNHLLLRAAEIALRLNPKVVALENVTAIRSGFHRRYWSKAITLFEQNGYRTAELDLDCARLGVPQMRKRVVLVATRGVSPDGLGVPLSDPVPLGAIGGRMPKDGSHRPVLIKRSSVAHRIVSRIAPGQKLSNVRNGATSIHTWNIPSVFGRTTRRQRAILEAMLILRRRLRKRKKGDADPLSAGSIARFVGGKVVADLSLLIAKGYVRQIGRHYDLCHTFNGKYRRLDWNRPSYTVDTRFGMARYFLHPDENRGLTVREAARIQGFPDSFRFPKNEADAYRLIGNAVPPPAAAKLADVILNKLFYDDARNDR